MYLSDVSALMYSRIYTEGVLAKLENISDKRNFSGLNFLSITLENGVYACDIKLARERVYIHKPSVVRSSSLCGILVNCINLCLICAIFTAAKVGKEAGVYIRLLHRAWRSCAERKWIALFASYPRHSIT